LTSRFFVNSRLDHSWAWIPACLLTVALCTAAFPPIFLQLRKGPLWSCAELLQSYALCSSDQCRTVKLPRRLPAAANYSGVCWKEGMGGGGVLVFQEVGTMKSLYWRCEMWFDCVERKRFAKLPLSTTAPRAFAATPSFQARLRAFICTFCICVCVYMCMCVCVRTCIYVYICMCVCICTSMRLYTCVCVCVCVFVHGLWVLVSVIQRVDGVMHAHVFSCAYVCVCVCVWVYIYVRFFAVSVTCTLQVF